MKYRNPIISGFFPDPSICRVEDTYYLVCSSFHYFPGVPLFESKDLINWEMIGHVLTRNSQLPLEKADSFSGIFAPTIRYHDERFYMVTTNVTDGGNFYVTADDIHGEWSEPIYVDQEGIDPSLYFEDGRAYFMSNGCDENGAAGILQCEIDIKTGKKKTESRCIWHGAGGRFLESPHLYKINGTYYLMAAEGGTEYGHMVVAARGDSPYGPFENNPANPILTNRNLGAYDIQGCGHADLVDDPNGNWWMVHLGFRQIDGGLMHHLTGREVYLVPVTFEKNGWFTAGPNGVTRLEIETDRISDSVIQQPAPVYTFQNTSAGKEWCFLRNPHPEHYRFESDRWYLTGTKENLCDYWGSPTFLAIRQKEMVFKASCDVTVTDQEAGITIYMMADQHYDLALRKTKSGFAVFRRICLGDAVQEDRIIDIPTDGAAMTATLIAEADYRYYYMKAVVNGQELDLGSLKSKFLSSEVAGNFTGVMIGLYAQGEGTDCKQPAVFEHFTCCQGAV